MQKTVAKAEPASSVPATQDNVEKPATLLQTIMRMTENPSFDIEKFDRLIQLQQSIEERQFRMEREREIEEQRRAFNDAMRNCQAALEPIAKNAFNPDTRSKYASYDKVAEAIIPVYTKFGFSIEYSPYNTEREGHQGVQALVAHSGGYEKVYRADIPVDRTGKAGSVNKTGTHAFGSTLSYGRRYLALLIFNVATKDDVDGNQRADTITEEQAIELQKMLESKNIPPKEFFDYMEVEGFGDIPANKFAKAKGAIARAKKPVPADVD